MENFAFVKKSRGYRQVLYYLIWGIFVFQIILFVLNFSMIWTSDNYFWIIFNMVFLSVFALIIYRFVLIKYKRKVDKANYKWFKIQDHKFIVMYQDKKIKGYVFNGGKNRITHVAYKPIILDTIQSISNLAYNIQISFSDKRIISYTLSYVKAKEFVQAFENKELITLLEKEIKEDSELHIAERKQTKKRLIPSAICFGISAFAFIYIAIILLGYTTTSGTYYANQVITNRFHTPINTYVYEVDYTSYTNQEDYTISFGGNLDDDITVFYRESNPNDSYSMYTVHFLMFITITFLVLGAIILNNSFSPYAAVAGLFVLPFYLLRLLNISFESFFISPLLIPVLSLLTIPVYLLVSAILKTSTDLYKFNLEHKLLKE